MLPNIINNITIWFIRDPKLSPVPNSLFLFVTALSLFSLSTALVVLVRASEWRACLTRRVVFARLCCLC